MKPSLTELLDNQNQLHSPYDDVAAEVATWLDAPEVYGFQDEYQEIFDKMLSIKNNAFHAKITPEDKVKNAYPTKPVNFIKQSLLNNAPEKITELKKDPEFNNWYNDQTTFHPAFQFIVELANNYKNNPDDEAKGNLTRTITALATCILSRE